MNWKLPGQLAWLAQLLRDDGSDDLADICLQAAWEIKLRRSVAHGALPTAIEEGDRANG
jgi:hypothetical protein